MVCYSMEYEPPCGKNVTIDGMSVCWWRSGMMLTLLRWEIATTEYVVPKSIPMTSGRIMRMSRSFAEWGRTFVPCCRPVNPLRARNAAMRANIPPDRIMMDMTWCLRSLLRDFGRGAAFDCCGDGDSFCGETITDKTDLMTKWFVSVLFR